ncbi:MAG: transporter substrate-binding domain-containing protein [Alphaproteobacteria bacterium]|nr:transporter substrate-binding domain-containing protein [Alphaproteobacteria bacterium]
MFFALLCALSLNPKATSAFEIAMMEGHNSSARLAPILIEIYKSIGIEAKVVTLPSKRTLYAVNKGTLDAEMIRVSNAEKEFPNLLRVPPPLYTFSGHIGGLKEKCGKYRTLKELQGVKVGLTNGIIWAAEKASKLGVQIVEKKDNAALLSGLVSGEYDCAFLADPVYKSAKKGLFSGFDLQIVFPNISKTKAFHFVHVRHKKLIPQLTKAIEARKKKGSILE